MNFELINRPCTLLLRNSGRRDAHGVPIQTETAVETVCELQQYSATELSETEISDTRWRLFLKPDEVFRTGDAVVVDGEVYETYGEPWKVWDPFEQRFDHIECIVRRTAGDEEGS